VSVISEALCEMARCYGQSKQNRGSCPRSILVTLCLALLAACARGTDIPHSVDETAAMVTSTRDQRDDIVPHGLDVATATPSLPDEVGGLELVGYLGSGPIRALTVQGNLAYVGLGKMLEIVRLTDPGRLDRAGYVVLPGDVVDVVVEPPLTEQVYAYVAVGQGGLCVVDVTDPAQPLVVGTHYVSTRVSNVAVSGAYLYVSAGGLWVMDLADPASPTEVGAYQPADPTGNAGKVVAVSDGYAYVIYGSGSSKAGSLRIVDVSDPTMPFEAGRYRAGTLVHDGAIVGPYAYLLVGLGRPYLVIVDISDPSQPVAVGPADTKAWLGQRLAAAGSTLYLTSPGPPDVPGYLQIVDASNPAYPVAVGRYEGVPLPVGEIVVRDKQVFLAAGDKLLAFDVSTPSAPAVWGSYNPRGLPGMVIGAAVDGDYVYIAAGRYGLLTVDASDPANPRLIGGLDTAGHAWNVALWAGYTYVADEFSGLRVIDVHDPAHPVEVGHDDVPGRSKFFADVVIRGPALANRSSGRVYAYVADALPENTSLRIVDVSDPAAPKQVGHLRLAEGEQGDVRAYGLAVDGDHAYMAVGGAGLRVVDVSDPSAPVEVGVLDVPGRANQVVVADDRAYLADGDLRIVDVSDPVSPREIGFYDVPNLSAWPYIAVAGRYVYLTARGTTVLDVSDPGALLEVAAYPLCQGHVTVANGLVYVTGDGLSILRPRAPTETAVSPTVAPKPECKTHTASLSLRANQTRLYVRDVLTVTAKLSNEDCGMLGMPQYSLHVEPDGKESPFAAMPESVIYGVGIAPGQFDTVEFVLRAGRPGEAALTVSASFEFHSGYPGTAYWASASSGPLHIVVIPPEPVSVPEGKEACLIPAEVPVKVCLPRGYSVSRSVEQSRRGSLVSYHLTSTEGGETPYLVEL
jgi:hypothetical protein